MRGYVRLYGSIESIGWIEKTPRKVHDFRSERGYHFTHGATFYLTSGALRPCAYGLKRARHRILQGRRAVHGHRPRLPDECLLPTRIPFDITALGDEVSFGTGEP